MEFVGLNEKKKKEKSEREKAASYTGWNGRPISQDEGLHGSSSLRLQDTKEKDLRMKKKKRMKKEGGHGRKSCKSRSSWSPAQHCRTDKCH